MNSIKTLFRRVLFIYLAITGFVLLNAGMISYAQTGDDLADTNQNTQNVNRTYEFVSSDVYNVTADILILQANTYCSAFALVNIFIIKVATRANMNNFFFIF